VPWIPSAGVIGFSGKIYAFGGFIEQNRNAIRDVYEYDVATNRWRELAPLPAKHGAMSVVELNGKLHLIGGRDEFSIRTHEVYDPATNSWSARAPLPAGAGRDHMGVVVMGGRIHAVGGRFDTFFYNADLHHAYDPATNVWQPRAPLPTARSGVAAAVLEGRLFVFGGSLAGVCSPRTKPTTLRPIPGRRWRRCRPRVTGPERPWWGTRSISRPAVSSPGGANHPRQTKPLRSPRNPGRKRIHGWARR